MIQQSHSWAYIQTKLCTPIFTAAPFTIAETRKQPKCPLTDEWIKIWYLYTVESYLTIKKNKIMPFAATWMEVEILIQVKGTRKEKTNTMGYHLFVESKIWQR